MNIAFLTKECHPDTVDAGFTTLLHLAKEFKKQNHTVVMISGRQKYTDHPNILPANKKFEMVDGIPIYRPYFLPWFKTNKWFLDVSVLFNRLLAAPLGLNYVQKKLKIKFDIIHSFSSSPALVLNNIIAKCFSRKAKKVHTIKSASLFDKYSLSPGSKLFYRLLNLSNSTIVSLNLIKEQLITNGCKKSRVCLINSPIDLKKLCVKKDKNKLRAKYGFRKNEKLVLYYGNMVPSKGTDVILDCIDHLPKESRIKILMIHATAWPNEYRDYVKKKKNSQMIDFIVKKVNVVDYLNMVDMVILPYKNLKSTEANPLCLLEAMACKTPIVTTCIPEIKELVEDYKDVLMAKSNNPKSLAEKIIEMINNPKLQKKLTNNAYTAVKKFDISIVAKKHVELYKKLL